MKPSTLIARCLLACAMTLALPLAHGAQFADVLDTPAVASPLASHALINGLAKAGTRLVAVGQRGHIVYSDDQGKRWTQAQVPVSADLVAVCFPAPQLGWAVGHDGVVLHSVDAGASWTRQLDGRGLAAILANGKSAGGAMAGQGIDRPFLDVWFLDAKRGFAVGAFNLILHTEDGGATWQSWAERTANPKDFHLNAIGAVGEALYIVGEQGLVMKMAKDGQRFEALATPYKGSFFGVVGRAGVVIVYGLRGNAYRSIDAGKSWDKVATNLQLGLNAGAALADGRFVLLSQAGHVLVSGDDGATFALAPKTTPGGSAALAAVDGALVIGGPRGLRLQPLANK